ncbi:MAG: hypothetical protein ACLP01_13385 [Solirubrobacteraceae bacterium]
MRQFFAGAVCRRLINAVAAVTVIAGVFVLPSAGLAANGWSGPTTIDNSNPPQYISCPSSTFCVAVGTNGYAQTYNGSSWGTPQFIDPSPNLSGSPITSISCPSTSFCAAVDFAGYALTFNGSSWRARTQIDTTGNSVTAVGCASASFCVAGDVGGNGFVYDGTSWSGPITINNTSNHESIGDIACPSASFCVAVGESGSVETATDGGMTWTNPPQIIGSDNLTSVSCPSTTFCVAVDTGGNAYTYNSGTWSAADPIDTTNGQFAGGALDSVTCPSSSFCAAFDSFEDVLMFNGSSWSAPQKLESGTVLHPGVSCASSSFCAAVDGGGDAFLYGAASAPTPPPPTPAPATLPPPVLGKFVNVKPVSGIVLIKLPAGKTAHLLTGTALAKGQGFIPLTEARQLPTGTQVDSRMGTIQLVAASSSHGKTQTGTFGGAIFGIAQDRTGLTKGLTTLSLLEGAFPGAPTYTSCPRADPDDATARAAHVNPKVLQTLHASDNHGKFRTRGRYSSATVRGTVWTISDRCDGTLTSVQRGTVLVSVFATRKTIDLHAGQSFLASAVTKKRR